MSKTGNSKKSFAGSSKKGTSQYDTASFIDEDLEFGNDA